MSQSLNPLEIFAASQAVRKFLQHKTRVIPNNVTDLAYGGCDMLGSKREQSPCERSLAPLGMTEFLLLKTCDEFFALFQQFFRHHAS